MRHVILILLLFPAFGCEVVSSNDVKTSGVYASMRVTATGDGTSDVVAQLLVGGALSNTSLDLSAGDRLDLIVGSDTQTMQTSKGLFGNMSYHATVADDRENTPFRIAFTRASNDPAEADCLGGDAPNSFATLPAPFDIVGPNSDDTFSRETDDILIEWNAFGHIDDIHLSIDGSCISSHDMNGVDDSGVITIPAGTLEPDVGEELSTCDLTIELRRIRTGMVDPAYGEGGTFTATQIRTRGIVSAP